MEDSRQQTLIFVKFWRFDSRNRSVMFAYLKHPVILEVNFGGRHSKATAIVSQTCQQNLKTKFDSALQLDDHDEQL